MTLQRSNLPWVGAGVLAFILTAATQQPKPTYDVVVVREWKAGEHPSRYRTDVFRQDPGRVLGQYSPLAALLGYAFDLSPSAAIEDLPDWGGGSVENFGAAAKFFVAVRMPPATSDAQSRLMMQSLLQDRFQLTWHWNQKPTKVLKLVVAPGGLKIKPPDPASDAPAPKGILTCPLDVSGCTFMGSRTMTMVDLARAPLPKFIFGRPALDKTGLSGSYFIPFMVLVPSGDVSRSAPGARDLAQYDRLGPPRGGHRPPRAGGGPCCQALRWPTSSVIDALDCRNVRYLR